MKHPHASRHNRTTSKNRYPYRRAATQSLGEHAVSESIQTAPSKTSHDNLIVNGTIHTIGLAQPDSEPLMTDSTIAESAALDAIGALDDSLTSNRMVGNKLLASIDPDRDSETLIALKQIGAKAFDRQLPDANFRTIVEDLDTTLTASDLRDFFMHLYESTHENGDGSEIFTTKAMNTLSGFRVEASFVRLAARAGFDVVPATKEQDYHGIDFIVEGVPFDIKSSRATARKHTDKHRDDSNREDTVKFIPPITATDFENHLVIPEDNLDHIVETTDFSALVRQAISEYQTTVSSAA